jgi:hypothetical protein
MTLAHPAPPVKDATDTGPKSPNFQFLAGHHRFLAGYAAHAERYLFKLCQFAELLAQLACANVQRRVGLGLVVPPGTGE